MLCIIRDINASEELCALDLDVIPHKGDIITIDGVVYEIRSLHWVFSTNSSYKPYVEIAVM